MSALYEVKSLQFIRSCVFRRYRKGLRKLTFCSLILEVIPSPSPLQNSHECEVSSGFSIRLIQNTQNILNFNNSDHTRDQVLPSVSQRSG